MSLADHAMTVANDDTLQRMITGASRRLIVVAPGVSMPVATALVRQWRRLDTRAVSVALDVDPEVCRLGFGDVQAMKLLERTAADLGTTLNTHPGLRIGVVIADDETLIFSPTPLNIEAGPLVDEARPVRPNAVRLGLPPIELERDLGAGPDGVKAQIIGLDKAERSLIKQIEAELEALPPQPFDISRLLRVYTAHLEFVELRLAGCMLNRRTVKVPSDLVGLADDKTRRLLESKFRLIDKSAAGEWGEELHRIRNFIVARFLVQVPTFGHVIRVRDKAKFELAVKTLQKMLNRSRERKCKTLQAAIERRLAVLHQALLPAVTRSPPQRWAAALRDSDHATLLSQELRDLAGTARELLAQAEVELRFKGVTYDTLNDRTFIEAVRQAMPDMTKLHDELDAAPVIPG